jgi:flagellin-like hook-associated protein FlgL
MTATDDILKNDAINVALFEVYKDEPWVMNRYPNDYDIFSGGTKTKTGSTGSTGITGGSVPWWDDLGNPTAGVGSSVITTAISSSNAKHGRLTLQVGADATTNNKITIFIDAMNAKTLGLLNVSVKTQDSSRYSIERVALALARVSEQRSELGSYQNRLEHTIKNLDNVVENTTASESQIRDIDMATELVKFYNTNILKQVGQSMLAQANQTNQGVLNLLS